MMRKRQHSKGFTLAEMLIVVGIIAVLAGVSFIAVHRYQRSMEQKEMDGLAKSVFMAAQEHLTIAQSQGYPGLTDGAADFGRELKTKVEGTDVGTGIYCLVMDSSNSATEGWGIYQRMLPPGAWMKRYADAAVW